MTLSLPLRVGERGLASLADDDPRALAQSVAVIIATPLGDRPAVPLFGSIDQLFMRLGDVQLDRAAVHRWDERIDDGALQVLTRSTDGTLLEVLT